MYPFFDYLKRITAVEYKYAHRNFPTRCSKRYLRYVVHMLYDNTAGLSDPEEGGGGIASLDFARSYLN